MYGDDVQFEDDYDTSRFQSDEFICIEVLHPSDSYKIMSRFLHEPIE